MLLYCGRQMRAEIASPYRVFPGHFLGYTIDRGCIIAHKILHELTIIPSKPGDPLSVLTLEDNGGSPNFAFAASRANLDLSHQSQRNNWYHAQICRDIYESSPVH
ncbi:hypothetical protein PoB_001369600 [Plakobranchus ocellatus]|uniref:Uncharacterized protein n=1 Tax=Plakobranchus ocellatus TaxID=259542 RepID=A0AAV3YXU8_9GAST|nr:hypothetical protein PoB_001369600 [Plakobranchus ocellatus]